ncbi:MAG: GatB/YqeY domain-containing protein [Terriglobales bacterium]
MMEKVQKDMTEAMRARDERRLSTLRMVKTALKNKEVEKMAALSDQEAMQVLNTLIKQRRDSIEQFTKAGRMELADKEAGEIAIIESYLPKAAGEDEIRATVRVTIAEMGKPTAKEMGAVMKNVMAKFQAQGARVDGKTVSEMVKRELSKPQ